ncbi:LamG-like jellyroll fold domain-containing protein [Ferruginibacter sp. SUN106]|uniref:LamG-like jellyroll fold domain-containing protein n=1 Tax=Ferruginibacter sp. SUN106 TaxID=2978348 RepID=UPI003D36ADA5
MKRTLLTLMAGACMYAGIAQPTAGLQAYFPMNGNFNDAGPNGIVVTNTGATSSTNGSGAANTAMFFNNPTSTVVQYATHPPAASLNFGTAQDFSVDFNMFITGPFVHSAGIYDNNLNYGGYGIWLWNSPGYLQINLNFKNGNVGTTNGALNVNTWYHICCQRSAGTLKIYINGVLNASAAEGTTVPAYTYAARFGTMFFNGIVPPNYNGLVGKIDEMRTYNRALTQAEITGLVLPVKLTSFTATKNNTDVLLQWQTEFEQNSSHFNLQRSTDGTNFTTIAKVNAAGNSSVKTNYQFTDNTAKTIAAGKNIFYRLEENDMDGRKDLSAIVLVKFGIAANELVLLQNPVTNELRLQLSMLAKQNASIQVTNAQGQQVMVKNLQLNAGETFTALPVSTLAKGTYYISLVKAGGEKQTLSFIKQ